MATTLEVIVKGVDNISGTFKKIDGSAGGLGKTLGGPLKIGALAGVAAIGGLVAAGVSFIKQAAEEEAGIKRLAAAIDASGGSWAKSGKAIENQIQQRQKLAFSDDELRSSLALLVAITGDEEEALSRQSVAMDFARGANIDLGTASKLLGKVTDETVNVLGRYGIRVKEGADATDVLALVQQKFSGQSAAFADSTAGKWARVNIQFDNIKETIGGALLPTVSRLAGEFADFLEENEDEIEKFGDDFEKFATETMPKVEASAKDVAESFVLVHDAVTPLIDAVIELDDALDNKLGKAFANNLPVIREFRTLADIKEVTDNSGESARGLTDDLAKLGGFAGDGARAVQLLDSEIGLFGGAADEAKQPTDDLKESIGASSGKALAFTSSLRDAITAGKDLPGGLAPASESIDALTQDAKDARDALFKMFKEPTAEEAAAEAVLASYESQLANINDVLVPLDDAQRAWLDSLNLTGTAADKTTLMAQGLTEAQADQYLQLKDNLIPEQRDHIDALSKSRDAAQKEAEAKLGTFPTQDEWNRKIAEGTTNVQGLHQKMDNLSQGGIPALSGSIDDQRVRTQFLREEVQEYTRQLGMIPSSISTALELKLLKDANWFDVKTGATGWHGEVSKPTIFIAGEGGMRERVDITPGGGASGGGGGGTIIVQVEAGEASLARAKRYGREIAATLRRELR